MEKRLRLCTTRLEQEMGHNKAETFLADGISQLPDAILVSILSLLPITEAARTSVLSHRWERLWTSFAGTLNFDASLFGMNDIEDVRPKERLKFVGRVNQALASLLAIDRTPSSPLDGFRVCFSLTKRHTSHIDSWIEFAMEKRLVKRIELNLIPGCCSPSKHYSFPQPRGSSTITSLTSLCLAYLNVSGETINCFLSSCPLLEQLCVKASWQLLNLKVTSSAVKLKYLEISLCSGLQSLEVLAPNLVSLKYVGHRIRLHVANVPQLVEVFIGWDVIMYLTGSLSSYISQLETLTLDVNTEFQIPKFPHAVELNKLKNLVLRTNPTLQDSLLGWSSLIEASPFLHKFTLQMLSPPKQGCRKIKKGPKCPHRCLKVVEIVGFVGFAADIEFARYLIANASTLEKIILDRRCPLDRGQPWELEKAQKKTTAKQRALRLERQLPPGVHLVLI